MQGLKPKNKDLVKLYRDVSELNEKELNDTPFEREKQPVKI